MEKRLPGRRGGGLPHVALRTDDLLGGVAVPAASGAPVELTNDGSDPVEGFSYHVIGSGSRWELIDTAPRPNIESWTRS